MNRPCLWTSAEGLPMSYRHVALHYGGLRSAYFLDGRHSQTTFDVPTQDISVN